MAVLKFNYIKRSKTSKIQARKTLAYNEADKEENKRILFDKNGPITDEEALQRIDEAAAHVLFFRMMLSPDVKTENKEKDLDLWELTDKLVMWLEKKLGRDIPYIGAVHNNTENPHVHTILLVKRFGREKPITVPVINQLRLLAAGQALEQQRKRSEPEAVVVFSPGQAAQEARAWLETLHAGMVIAEAWAEELASRQAARPSVRLEGRPLVQQPTVRLRHAEQQPGSFPSLRHARLRESGDLSPSVRSAGTPASVVHPLAQQPLTGRAGGSSPARHYHHYRLPTLCPRCGQFHEFGECEARKEEKSRERRI